MVPLVPVSPKAQGVYIVSDQDRRLQAFHRRRKHDLQRSASSHEKSQLVELHTRNVVWVASNFSEP